MVVQYHQLHQFLSDWCLDHKDNNPWIDDFGSLAYSITSDGRTVRIGDGEPNDTGDPDNDGVMGEDWFNCYDDDGDGLIDEDYFEADGIDNDGDCPGDTNFDGCICCSGDNGVDENIDSNEDIWLEEYIVNPPTHILNGFIWGIWGVYDYWLLTNDKKIKNLFDNYINTIKNNLYE